MCRPEPLVGYASILKAISTKSRHSNGDFKQEKVTGLFTTASWLTNKPDTFSEFKTVARRSRRPSVVNGFYISR
jgi:hypothetical protein